MEDKTTDNTSVNGHNGHNGHNDYIVRATAAEGAIRAFAAVTTGMVQKAHDLHQTSAVASAALGRTMTAAAMMSQMFKNDRDVLTIQIKGEGPLGGIVVVSDSRANVRGYVYNPVVELPLNAAGKLDVSGAIGPNGYLNVIKDLGLKEPYIGYVQLVSGEIAEDIAYYFASSEQVPSVVALGTLVNPDGSIAQSGGFIIQLMPGAPDEVVTKLEDSLIGLAPVTSMLAEGKTPEEILDMVIGWLGLEINSKSPCEFRCNCSRERMEKNLISLGAREILNIAEEQHGAELHCHFCNSKYFFEEAELHELAGE
jgi:molecular chaperone Hsp33